MDLNNIISFQTPQKAKKKPASNQIYVHVQNQNFIRK